MTEKTATDAPDEGFTAEERAAMKERAKELKTTAGRKRTGKSTPEADEKDVLEKIAEMPEPDRVIAEAIHAIVAANAPELAPKTWYGMPGYAKNGKVVVFFQGAAKFKTRYASLGFNDNALIDEGTMWPVAYALTQLTADDEARIAALIAKAAS
ncbi:iron chaperone [Glaciihabitans sp. dw_435]|uniref:iron chaperone n=1 Tax=Glaciihabitans sp. dw_435 TaxID=2720081 RepID=UPI001BD3FA63|nr:DUF1801 domain-containing protein [Glaciihabitans sp. dw_435]